VSIGFKNRSTATLNPLKEFIEALVEKVYKLQPFEVRKMKLELQSIESGEGTKLIYKVPDDKNESDHAVLIEELKKCVETRHLFCIKICFFAQYTAFFVFCFVNIVPKGTC